MSKILALSILGHTFHLLQPYEPGHPLTSGEAQALNQLRNENIRNNMRKLVKEAMAETPNSPLTQEKVVELQLRIDNYSNTYQFTSSAEGPIPTLGALEREVRLLAEEKAEEAIRATGVDFDTWLQGKDHQGLFEQKIKELTQLPELVQEARNRIAIQQQVAKKVFSIDQL